MSTNQAKEGDRVTVQYTVSVCPMGEQNGGEPPAPPEDPQALRFVLGQDSVVHGFDRAVVGMRPGESKAVTVLPEQAYGHRREDLIWTIDRDAYPRGVDPEPGQRLELPVGDGPPVKVRVTRVGESTVEVDGNHPLAGHALTFQVSLLEIT